MLEYMFEQARLAKKNAYAPYSNYHVGCCLRTENSKFFSGCNVENAVFPSGQCAEASTIGAMITAGEKRILEVVVLGSGEFLCAPCGNCRQMIREFAAEDTKIHLCGDEGFRKTLLLTELLPYSFGPINLGKAVTS